MRKSLLVIFILTLVVYINYFNYEQKFFRFRVLSEEKVELISKVDTWQYIGPKTLRIKVYNAYFDDRKELFGMINVLKKIAAINKN